MAPLSFPSGRRGANPWKVQWLRECGYEVVEQFYTFGGVEAPGAPNKSAAAKALRVARKMLYYVNRELMVRVLGGASVLVLAK